MLRRMSFLAPALALTIGLGGCMATETLSINPFAKRGIIRDAGAETASLNPVRTPSLSTRAVVRLAPDITVAGMQLSRVHAESLPGWKTERHGDATGCCLVAETSNGTEFNLPVSFPLEIGKLEVRISTLPAAPPVA